MKQLKNSMLLIAIVIAMSQVVWADVLFDVDFNSDTVGNTPTTAGYTPGTTKPTAVNVAASNTATVVASLGALTDQPVEMNNGADNTGRPEMVFDGGNDLVTSGVVSLEWDICVTEHTLPTSGGAETVAAAYLRGNAGAGVFAMTYTALNTTTGTLSSIWGSGYDSGADLSWTVGTAYHYELQIDLDNATYSIWKNDTQIATDKALSGTLATFGAYRLLDLKDGASVGGSDGSTVYALDNILIQTVPEPCTMGLMGLGLLGWTLRRKRS